MAGYQPQFRYFLFDEGRVPVEQAGRAGNAVASLLALEASRDLDTLRNEIARLRRRLSAPEHDSLRRAFTVWIHCVALGRTIPGQDVPRTETLEETETMLAERVTQWTREWEREGLEAGRQEGRQGGLLEGLLEGRQEGEEGRRQTLQRLLVRRFGPLPDTAMARMETADAGLLDEWTERLRDVSTLYEPFQAAP